MGNSRNRPEHCKIGQGTWRSIDGRKNVDTTCHSFCCVRAMPCANAVAAPRSVLPGPSTVATHEGYQRLKCMVLIGLRRYNPHGRPLPRQKLTTDRRFVTASLPVLSGQTAQLNQVLRASVVTHGPTVGTADHTSQHLALNLLVPRVDVCIALVLGHKHKSRWHWPQEHL